MGVYAVILVSDQTIMSIHKTQEGAREYQKKLAENGTVTEVEFFKLHP